MSTLAARFAALAHIRAAEVAIVDAESERRWTYRELAIGMRAVVAALTERGCAPGMRVATLGSSAVHFLIGELGVLASGCVRVPLDPSLTLREQRAQLLDAGAFAILHEPQERERAGALCAITLDVTEIESVLAPAEFPARVDPQALASLNYTGGTTGVPKAVMLTHAALDAIHRTIVAERPVHEDDVFLNVRPLWPIAAVVVTAHLYAGATIVLGGRFDPARFPTLLERYRATGTSLVPTMLVRVFDALDRPLAGLKQLRAIDVGGSALSEIDRARAEALFGARLGVIYGLTEASWTCYLRPGEPSAPGIVGRPLGPNRVVIRDPEARALRQSEEGEVTITGPHLMSGYWNRPQATAASLRKGWLHTGDLGRIDAAGRLVITGRLKDVIRTGSRTVVPAEVEAVIAAHPAVAACAVLGVPDPEWGEIVAAAVVLKPAFALDAATLAAYCGAQLSGFKKPRRIVFVAAIPRSHYGKVQRAKLIALLSPDIAAG